VKHVIFSLNGDSAPNPNGFDGCFYHSI